MTDRNLDTEWDRLCREFEARRAEHFAAFGPVTQKFGAIGTGKSRTNPSDEELNAYQSTWQALQDVMWRMDEFVKAHT